MPNPYYQPVISPPGGANESEIPLDMGRDYVAEAIDSGVAAYKNRKEATKQKKLEDAKYASMIAEAQGKFTPELEKRVLAPTGEEATLGESALGGLGRLLGIENQMGEGTAPLTAPGGLKTKYERELEKAEREAGTKYNEFLRGLFKEQFKSDVGLEQKKKEMEAGILVPKMTFDQQKALIKEKAKARATYGGGRPLSAKEQLKMDIYTGVVDIEDLDEADMLILDKYWNSMTPEARAEDALSYAQEVAASVIKGDLKSWDEKSIKELTDNLAADYIQKQNDLMTKIRPKSGPKRRRRRGEEEPAPGTWDAYEKGKRDAQGRRPLGSIMSGY